MSDRATDLLLVMATLIVGLFCAGFAIAQVIQPQVFLAGILP